jgi:hypothetical protein
MNARILLPCLAILIECATYQGKSCQTIFDENPVTEAWIRAHIQSLSPRLILTPDLERELRENLEKADPVTLMNHQLLIRRADNILDMERLTRKQTGKRLLSVSREALRRLTVLSLAYRIEKKEAYLVRLEDELNTVSDFTDWNPSHFLDVAEMAAGVALALDWAGEWISDDTRERTIRALVDKALIPGMGRGKPPGWVNSHNNWNLVCHGGLSLAALAVFEEEPGISTEILKRAIDKIPNGLEPYGPDGNYPEGTMYWFYATNYLTSVISAFESCLGTDFGFSQTGGLMESAVFSQVMAGPSGNYYNYFDSRLEGFQSPEHLGLLSWFSARSDWGIDQEIFRSVLEKELSRPENDPGHRLFPIHYLWAIKGSTGEKSPFSIPETWYGKGDEPVVVFRDAEGMETFGFYLAAKGGRAADSHGNMDAGSFIFEMDGIRWSVDPGNQSYFELEQLMGNELWNTSQESGRWDLLVKSNFGHSSLTINGEKYLADARATLVHVDKHPRKASASFDLTPVFGPSITKAIRSFHKDGNHILRIVDDLEFSPQTECITWQLMTVADVALKAGVIELNQEGKTLYLYPSDEIQYEAKVVGLSPPPLPYDKNIPGLKRIEIVFLRNSFPGPNGKIVVKLTPRPFGKNSECFD